MRKLAKSVKLSAHYIICITFFLNINDVRRFSSSTNSSAKLFSLKVVVSVYMKTFRLHEYPLNHLIKMSYWWNTDLAFLLSYSTHSVRPTLWMEKIDEKPHYILHNFSKVLQLFSTTLLPDESKGVESLIYFSSISTFVRFFQTGRFLLITCEMTLALCERTWYEVWNSFEFLG